MNPITLFIIGSNGSTEKQLAVWTLSTRRQFAARKPIKSQIFSTRGKPPSSLHRRKCLKAKYPHACCWKRRYFGHGNWLKEMFISSNMRGDIALLNIYFGAVMMEVCLWSKKSVIRWFFWPQTVFEYTRFRPPAVFLCCLYFLLSRVTGVKQ